MLDYVLRRRSSGERYRPKTLTCICDSVRPIRRYSLRTPIFAQDTALRGHASASNCPPMTRNSVFFVSGDVWKVFGKSEELT